MRLAFILDPLDSLKVAKDSSIAMMRAAQAAGHAVWAIEQSALHYSSLHGVCAEALHLELSDDDTAWYREVLRHDVRLRDFAAVIMRKDPPFDFDYLASTWLLERAAAEGAQVFNRPAALREHSEKLALLEFPQFAAPMLVSGEMARLHGFIDRQQDVILKPLDGMGGHQVFRVRHDDPNRRVIVETLTQHGKRTIMAQRYLPEIALGDRRILLIGGEVVPYALARFPPPGETRANLAVGGQGVVQELTPQERQIAETLAPQLAKRGLLLAGIDVIGGHLTEINVTSPTGMVEIAAQTGFDAAAMFVAAVERELDKSSEA